MVGAFIADLAAWTFLNEPKAIFSHLISGVAQKSEYSDVMLFTANTLLENPNISKEDFMRRHTATFGYRNARKSAVYDALCSIVIGWIYGHDDISEAINKYCTCEDKEALYASYFCAHIIRNLRTGLSKRDAALVDFCGSFSSFTKEDSWKNGTGILGYFIRAWMSFNDSFDFSSAIFNAIQLNGDVHLNSILAGALADAMYGCNRHYIKKKYGEGRFLDKLPFISEDIYRIHCTNRKFFPKNNALTNVERHHWFDEKCPFADKIIDKELKRRILVAFHTGWDDRYGFYLDDGWIYVYRSHILLARFILVECSDGTHRIRKYQKSDEGKQYDSGNVALENALYSVEHRWDLVSDPKDDKLCD